MAVVAPPLYDTVALAMPVPEELVTLPDMVPADPVAVKSIPVRSPLLTVTVWFAGVNVTPELVGVRV